MGAGLSDISTAVLLCCYRIDDCQSTSRNVTSGVPQCSVLGPLLFLIYVNDLPAQVQSYCRVADDVILYNTSQNRSAIEQDLNHLKIWEKTGRCHLMLTSVFYYLLAPRL